MQSGIASTAEMGRVHLPHRLSPVFGEVGSKALEQNRKLSLGLQVPSCSFTARAEALFLRLLYVLQDHQADQAPKGTTRKIMPHLYIPIQPGMN